MLNFILRFIVLVAIVSPAFASRSRGTEIEMIEDIIELYRTEIREKFRGREIVLNVVESYQINAYADIGEDGGPVITFYTGMLHQFDDNEIIDIACHEVGHLLGNTSFASAPTTLAVEGEADYFSGACAVRYFREMEGLSEKAAQEKAILVAKASRSKLERRRLDAGRARDVSVNGVLIGYPEADCRVLSIINGALRRPRPACWFNPQ